MREALLKEAELGTDAVEEEEQKLKECVALLYDNVPGEPASEELLLSLSSAVEAEKAAKAALVHAHQALVGKTGELKKLAGGSTVSAGTVLGKLQNRQSAAFRSVMKHQETIKTMEERLRVKDLLAEFVEKCQIGEAEVDKVAQETEAFSADEEPSAEACKKLDSATKNAETKLKTTIKFVDLKLRSAKGVSREELEAIQVRLKKSEKTLTGLTNSVKEKQERGQVTELVLAVNIKVENAESAAQQCKQSQSSLSDETPAEEVQELLIGIESSVSEAEAACKAAQDAIKKQLAAAKAWSELSHQRISQELSIMQNRVEQVAAQLDEIKTANHEYKKANRNQMVEVFLAQVDKTVERLKELVGKVATEDQLIALSEEALTSLRQELSIAGDIVVYALS
jgi:hypothetical protein